MPRTKLMAANWKMFKTADRACDFLSALLPLVKDHTRDQIVVCPPFLCIPSAVEVAKGSNVAIGGQNLHWERKAPSPAKSRQRCCSRRAAPTSSSAIPNAASISARPTTR